MKDLQFQITDHSANDVCTSSYVVHYRETGEGSFQRLLPDPAGPNVTVPKLKEGVTYEVKVERVCCNEAISQAALFSVTVPTEG